MENRAVNYGVMSRSELLERWYRALEGLPPWRVTELTRGVAPPTNEQEKELIELAPLARERRIY